MLLVSNVKFIIVFGLLSIYGLFYVLSSNFKLLEKKRALTRFEQYVKDVKTCLNLNSSSESVVMCKEIYDGLYCLEMEFEKLLRNEKDFIRQWEAYSNVVLKCSDRLLKTLTITKYKNNDEEKLFIGPIDNVTSLRVMTLGIGKDIKAEMALKTSYPQTEFYGVDLDETISGNMFEKQLGGKYLKGLVGLNHGEYSASVFDFNQTSGYTDHILPHYSFKEIIKTFQIKDHIDLLLMDIEGDEFALIPDIMLRSQNYPTICQINVEFHDPPKYSAMNMTEIMVQISTRGKYLYLYQLPAPHRSYFINVMDSYCLNKFFGL